EKFLEVAKNSEINFESSLLVYTEKTRNIIGYLTKLRPSSEEDVIEFISQIEKTGQDLGLNVKLETYKDPIATAKASKKSTVKEDAIRYKLDFFGTEKDMNAFLKKVESLPYFIKVENISFKNFDYVEKTENAQPNIRLTIKLYIR
ncbi:MAG: hypothetical protein PHP74_03880, partial [Candidatus Gracilibacteria bacterium]|nr:hypothetical protein [Candidatus Gracilibacteria bacterium]